MIEEAKTLTPELEAAMRELLAQLNPDIPFSLAALEKTVTDPNVHLFILRVDDDGRIAGALSLALCPLLSGTKAWIEDVVVASWARHRGYARALLEHALCEARRLGARKLLLTSRPERAAANALYQGFGFVRRDTNVYQMILV